MAKSNLAKKLTKELTRNPKKTAVLGLLGLVAMWFWAPLVWKWLAPEGETAVAAAPESSAAAPAISPTSTGTTPTAPAGPELNWKQLAELVANDKLMASAAAQSSGKDPFAKPAIAKVVEKKEEASSNEELAAPAVPPSPQQLGLVLTSTITGGRIRLATINGKLCQLGAVLVVPVGNVEHEFTIVDIAPHAVTMKSATDAYTLEHARPNSSVQLSRADVHPTLGTGEPSHGERIIIHAFGQE